MCIPNLMGSSAQALVIKRGIEHYVGTTRWNLYDKFPKKEVEAGPKQACGGAW